MVNSTTPQTKKASSKWLLILLAITITLTLWTAINDHNTADDDALELLATPNDRVKQRPTTPLNHLTVNPTKQPADGLIPWQNLKRELPTVQVHDAFKVPSSQSLRIAINRKPSRKLAPKAPPVPFEYMGKLEGAPNQESTIFLWNSSKLYAVAIGDIVTPQWRLDAEDVDMLRLTYIPLNTTQTLLKTKVNR